MADNDNDSAGGGAGEDKKPDGEQSNTLRRGKRNRGGPRPVYTDPVGIPLPPKQPPASQRQKAARSTKKQGSSKDAANRRSGHSSPRAIPFNDQATAARRRTRLHDVETAYLGDGTKLETNGMIWESDLEICLLKF